MLKNSDGFGRLRILNFRRVAVVEYSSERINDDPAVNGVKILRIPGDQWETSIEGGGRDQCVWKTNAVLLARRYGPLHYGFVEWDFLKLGEQAHRLLQLVRALWITQDFDPAHYRDDGARCDPGLDRGKDRGRKRIIR